MHGFEEVIIQTIFPTYVKVKEKQYGVSINDTKIVNELRKTLKNQRNSKCITVLHLKITVTVSDASTRSKKKNAHNTASVKSL